MIEAFEIGVSLALRDGVSDSISLAQRNLTAFENAVNSNGVAIQSLRDAGLRAASIPVMASRQPPSPPAAQGVKNTNLIDAGRVRAADDAPEGALPLKIGARNVEAVTPLPVTTWAADPSRAGVSASEPTLQPSAPSSAPVDRTAGVRLAAPIAKGTSQELENSTSLLPAIGIRAPEGSATGLAMPPPKVSQSSIAAIPSDIIQRPSPLGSLHSVGKTSSPQSLELALFANSNVAACSLDREDERKVISEGEAGSDSQSETKRHDSLIAKASLLPKYDVAEIERESLQNFRQNNDRTGLRSGSWAGFPTETPRLSDRSILEDQRRSIAPQLQRNEPQDLAGDVYLDGMLLGRWVSRFLQKQAERADAGPTGFDAKRGRLLPGVTVGG